MALVSGHEVVEACRAGGFVAGAFNTTNLETTMGIVAAIERTGVPTFIQLAPTNVTLSGWDYVHDMVRRRTEALDVPVALHLDHGRTIDDVRAAMRAGFTSFMLDASALPYEENVALSAQARLVVGPGFSLEVELGSIGGKEDDVAPEHAATTDPSQVADFVAATGADMLAVSVGNAHGYVPGAAIDFELLEQVRAASPLPLVIHGGSGLPEAQMSHLGEHGVVKVNIASDLRNAMIRAFGEAYVANPKENSLIKVSHSAVDAIGEVVERWIRVLNPRLGR